MNDKVRFAVIGCGHIGKRHAAMITNNAHCELAALVDAKSREELSLDNYDVPFFRYLDELLEANIDFDVLSIATPNSLHETHAIKALQANKHVVIEKPMSLTKMGCEKIVFEALHQGRYVFCVMQNRYSPPSVWLKQIIKEGILGKIYMVQINCYWNRDERYYTKKTWHGTWQLDGGTLFTQFSHFIDIMYWIFGDIQNIVAHLKDFNHQHLTEFEDSGIVYFEFIHGGMGCFNFSTAVWDKNLESSITVIAENGTVKIGGQYMNEVEYCHINNYTMKDLPSSNPPNDYGSYKGSAANHHFIFENVIDVLHSNGRITTNALEGMKVVDIIERIYNAAGRTMEKSRLNENKSVLI